jgi:uncharacterized protein (DUF433 family)
MAGETGVAAMQVEDYLELDDPDGIRIKGHRIWLFHLLYEVVYHGMGPEGLLERFPTLNREKIYATLLYIEQHRDEVMKAFFAEVDRRERNATEQGPKSDAMFEELRRRMAARQKAAS